MPDMIRLQLAAAVATSTMWHTAAALGRDRPKVATHDASVNTEEAGSIAPMLGMATVGLFVFAFCIVVPCLDFRSSR
eukprot:3695952-Rhodomonas_salina.1